MASTDILFPEEEPSFESANVYSPSSTHSNYSTYSQEVKYVFRQDHVTSYSRQSSAFSDESRDLVEPPAINVDNGMEDLYAAPRRMTSQAKPPRKLSANNNLSPPKTSPPSYRCPEPEQPNYNQQNVAMATQRLHYSSLLQSDDNGASLRTGNQTASGPEIALFPPKKPPRAHHLYGNLGGVKGPPRYHGNSTFNRRRTWSPPAFERLVADTQNNMRSYHSNDQLDAPEVPDVDLVTAEAAQFSAFPVVLDGSVVVEGSAAEQPPRMQSSGILNTRNAHARLVKPIAFKPVILPNRYHVSTPPKSTVTSSPEEGGARGAEDATRLHSGDFKNGGGSLRMMKHHSYKHSQDEGYRSEDYSTGYCHNSPPTHHVSTSNIAQLSLSLAQVSPTLPPARAASQSRGSLQHLDHQPRGSLSRFEPHASAENSLGRKSRPLAENYRSAQDLDQSASTSAHSSFHSAHSVHSGAARAQNYLLSHTPSPSDSGLGEVETMLRTKEEEIQHLRQTMELNESAIIQVCQEKEQMWDQERAELVADWSNKLQRVTQKAFKTEQGLLMQLFKAQQDKKTLQLDLERATAELAVANAAKLDVEKELREQKDAVDRGCWDLQQKQGELAMAKQQLKEAQGTSSSREADLLEVRTQLRALRDEHNLVVERLEESLRTAREDAQSARSECDSLRAEVRESRTNNNTIARTDNHAAELERMREDIKSRQEEFAREKLTWQAEKEKVIRYQKHLQLNYVQMMRKNTNLEQEVEQLTLELENRDVGSMEGEESLC